MNAHKPFREFILKIHGRCDLACDHCYVYTKADQRWRERSAVMSREIIDLVAARIAAHVHAHRLPFVDVVLHGGEPLLAGADRLRYCVSAVRCAVDADVRVSLQTNGVRLGPFLELFEELGVRVGVSLDGYRAAHDRHRRGHDGAGSYEAVARAVRLLTEHPAVYGGLLCTVDVANDPVRVYEALLEFAPPTVDFLLPNGNWSDRPPPGDYAGWLIAVFDRWYSAPEQETNVRMFAEIVNVLLGGSSALDGVGTSVPGTVVVETDGSIERSDMLSTAFSGAAATGMHVSSASFDDVLLLPGVLDQRSVSAPECLDCDLLRVCGGGTYAHRYRAGNGFANPSVYCADLYRLITHIRSRLVRDLSRSGC